MAKVKKKKSDKTKIIVGVIFILISIFLLFSIKSLNILPNKYYNPLTIFIIILNVLMIIVLNTFKNLGKIFTIIGIICGVYVLASIYNTKDVFTSMNNHYKTNNYMLIVNKNSKYNKIKDLDRKSIGYIVDNVSALKELKIEYEKKEYEDILLLANDIINNSIDSIIIDKSYYEMLVENDSQVKKFKDSTKVIYEFSINTKVEKIVKEVEPTNESFAIYISGIDTYGKITSSSRSDANMLLIVNPKVKQVLMISIPRDYYVTLHGKNAKDKLTHSGIFGVENTVKTVEDLLNIDINYYFKINFTSLINIIDSIDGVDVYSKYTFKSKDGYNYKKGYNHVNGAEALSFVRERKYFSAGDRVRNLNQQALLEAMIRKCTSISILTKYNSLINNLKNSFITNMSMNKITSLINMQLEDNSKWNITSYSLDGSNSREYTYMYKSIKLYVMKPDTNSINKAKELINLVYKGNKLKNSYKENVNKINTVIKDKKVNSNSNSNDNSNINKVKTYSVTFKDGDNETVIQTSTGLVEYKEVEKEGYKFIGWYLDEKLFDFNTKITRDIILVAQYEPIFIEENKNE